MLFRLAYVTQGRVRGVTFFASSIDTAGAWARWWAAEHPCSDPLTLKQLPTSKFNPVARPQLELMP